MYSRVRVHGTGCSGTAIPSMLACACLLEPYCTVRHKPKTSNDMRACQSPSPSMYIQSSGTGMPRTGDLFPTCPWMYMGVHGTCRDVHTYAAFLLGFLPRVAMPLFASSASHHLQVSFTCCWASILAFFACPRTVRASRAERRKEKLEKKGGDSHSFGGRGHPSTRDGDQVTRRDSPLRFYSNAIVQRHREARDTSQRLPVLVNRMYKDGARHVAIRGELRQAQPTCSELISLSLPLSRSRAGPLDYEHVLGLSPRRPLMASSLGVAHVITKCRFQWLCGRAAALPVP
ncbi:hypothetical protein V8C35DRAFT_316687 [Trichoderma chlorosporum]